MGFIRFFQVMMMVVFERFIILAYVLATAQAVGDDGPVVQTTNGPVQGTKDPNTGFVAFHGVPFAAPPTKDLRWLKPRAPVAWRSPLKATEPAPMCPQFDFIKGIMFGKEDCLYLSVYVPSGCTESSPCPVMRWIYGGAWMIGSNEEFGFYDATRLADQHGVVVVAANYRLDVLGWLALQELEDEASGASSGAGGPYGNYGLLDQQFALSWTQQNVGAFGGDPNQVTIFGESAGGFSVCQHLAAPGSNGLFTRAIMESADCDGPWLISDGMDAKAFGDVYMHDIGCPNTLKAADRLACMRAKSTEDILEPYISWFCLFRPKDDPWCNKTMEKSAAAGNISSPTRRLSSNATAVRYRQMQQQQQQLRAADDHRYWPTPVPPFAPIAGWTATVDGTTLPDVPVFLFEQGKVNKGPQGEKISVIMGSNKDEMALFVIALGLVIPGVGWPIDNSAMDKIVNHIVQYHDNWNISNTGPLITAAYPHGDYKTEAYRVTTAGTDFIFRCGTRTSARTLAAQGHDVYLYEFAYHFDGYIDPTSEFCELDDQLLCGNYHSSELKFVFDKLGLEPSDSDKRVSGYFGSYWTNMAKYGSPNAPNSSEPLQYWSKYDVKTDLHLEINDPPVLKSGLAKQRCDLWDSLPRQGKYPH